MQSNEETLGKGKITAKTELELFEKIANEKRAYFHGKLQFLKEIGQIINSAPIKRPKAIKNLKEIAKKGKDEQIVVKKNITLQQHLLEETTEDNDSYSKENPEDDLLEKMFKETLAELSTCLNNNLENEADNIEKLHQILAEQDCPIAIKAIEKDYSVQDNNVQETKNTTESKDVPVETNDSKNLLKEEEKKVYANLSLRTQAIEEILKDSRENHDAIVNDITKIQKLIREETISRIKEDVKSTNEDITYEVVPEDNNVDIFLEEIQNMEGSSMDTLVDEVEEILLTSPYRQTKEIQKTEERLQRVLHTIQENTVEDIASEQLVSDCIPVDDSQHIQENTVEAVTTEQLANDCIPIDDIQHIQGISIKANATQKLACAFIPVNIWEKQEVRLKGTKDNVNEDSFIVDKTNTKENTPDELIAVDNKLNVITETANKNLEKRAVLINPIIQQGSYVVKIDDYIKNTEVINIEKKHAPKKPFVCLKSIGIIIVIALILITLLFSAVYNYKYNELQKMVSFVIAK